ncbi:hypothetical protein NHX12_007001 [Muraenolepis orangiensis]|uniref:Uncharacterized protein n=1 Tax=Muraenolepis orangiensis TaxID=630683 RepID=A0A9Q0DNA9_9TELE|nr:hypothetical protein NHX12_007001 [Muraenolepis orangiensis]
MWRLSDPTAMAALSQLYHFSLLTIQRKIDQLPNPLREQALRAEHKCSVAVGFDVSPRTHSQRRGNSRYSIAAAEVLIFFFKYLPICFFFSLPVFCRYGGSVRYLRKRVGEPLYGASQRGRVTQSNYPPLENRTVVHAQRENLGWSAEPIGTLSFADGRGA